MKRLFFFAMTCFIAMSLSAQDYVDLGLPSGTLWKNVNEEGFYSYEQAMATFGEQMPTEEQFDELRKTCQWIWIGLGYQVVGPNGRSIVFPAMGYRTCKNKVDEIGTTVNMWIYKQNNEPEVWGIFLDQLAIMMTVYRHCAALSVRLVK